MSISVKPILPLLASSLLFGAVTSEPAQAALVRRSFDLNATSPYIGSGYFDYDDSPLADPNSDNYYANIVRAFFGYAGKPLQQVVDPSARVNFDSQKQFLGIDLLLPLPSGADSNAYSVLVANEFAYVLFQDDTQIPLAPPEQPTTQVLAALSQADQPVVTYGNPTAVPSPALLPGLVALGLGMLRRKKAVATGESVEE
jgi:hypothetical protein